MVDRDLRWPTAGWFDAQSSRAGGGLVVAQDQHVHSELQASLVFGGGRWGGGVGSVHVLVL